MTLHDVLKKEIIEKVCEYYKNFHAKNKKFIPGESKINYAGRVFDDSELCNLIDSSLEFWLTHGRFSRQFEKQFANFLGIKYAYLVNSGSSANLLAFMALTSPLLKDRAIKRGDEIITVAAGFPTTVAPIIQYGAIPVFVDIDLETININVKHFEDAISPNTKAVMLAHTLGNPFDIKKIKEICDMHGLWLIEDNCDSLGSEYENKYTGTWGDIGTSSFYPPHHMTMGEGGAVYTNNTLLKKIILSMRDWGRDCWCESGKDNSCLRRFNQKFGSLPYGYDHKYVYSHFGYNLKATDLQAAIGCAQLDKIENFIQKRRDNFKLLYEELKVYQDLFYLPKATDRSKPSWFGFWLTVKDTAPFKRIQIVEYLENANIQTRNIFSGNIIRQPCFNSLKKNKDYIIHNNLINTDKIMNDCFWIGVYPGMQVEEINYIVYTIKKFINLF